MSCIFCILKKPVDLFLEILSSALKPTQWLWRWFSASRTGASLLFFANSIWEKFISTWASLCVARFSRASLKDDTKSRGLESLRKMGSHIQLDDIEITILKFECASQSMLIYLYPWNTRLPHRLIQNQKCHVHEEILVVCKKGTKRVRFVKQCFTELIHVFWGKYA